MIIKPRIALDIVAFLFLLTAIHTIIHMCVAISSKQLLIPWGLLGFPIFYGLRRFHSGWRRCGLVLLWIPLVVFPIAAILGLTFDAPLYLELFGLRLVQVSYPVFLAFVITFWLLAFWEYRVLTRPEVRRLFQPTYTVT